jgi:hypothetical protein
VYKAFFLPKANKLSLLKGTTIISAATANKAVAVRSSGTPYPRFLALRSEYLYLQFTSKQRNMGLFGFDYNRFFGEEMRESVKCASNASSFA